MVNYSKIFNLSNGFFLMHLIKFLIAITEIIEKILAKIITKIWAPINP